MGLGYYVMHPFGTQPNTTMNQLGQLSRLGHPKPVWTPCSIVVGGIYSTVVSREKLEQKIVLWIKDLAWYVVQSKVRCTVIKMY